MPRLKLDVSPDLAEMLRGWAKKYDTTVDDIISRAIVGMALIRAARQRGLKHLGFVADSRQLDAELRGLFPEQPHVVIAGQ